MDKISDTEQILQYIERIYHKPMKNEKIDENLVKYRLLHFFHEVEQKYNLKLSIKEDKFGNIALKKPSITVSQNRPSLLLQAHYDSYSITKLKNLPNSYLYISKNTQKEEITLHGTPYFDDSIIGLGIICYLLDQQKDEISSYQLEILITRKQNEKFLGVSQLNSKDFPFESHFLLNFDGVDLATITSCTGGCSEFILTKEISQENEIQSKFQFVELSIEQLLGGDMGSEIHYFRGNAIQIIARILAKIQSKYSLYLKNWKGGKYYRFIPRESIVEFAIEKRFWEEIEKLLKKEQMNLNKKYHRFTDFGDNIEPDFQLKWKMGKIGKIYNSQATKTMIGLANLIPHGLITPLNPEPDENKLCNNFAKVNFSETRVSFHIRVRWTDEYEYEHFCNQLKAIAHISNWDLQNHYFIPMWNPKSNRPFTQFVQKIYEKVIYQPVRLVKSFWTMELGVLEQKYPKIEAVAIGPTEIGVYPNPYKIKMHHIQALYQLLRQIFKHLPNLETIKQ